MTTHANQSQKDARLAGLFFITATVSAIIGLKLYDPVMVDLNSLVSGVRYTNQVVLGAVFELILACSAVGTAIVLFPYLKTYSKKLGLGYVCFRLLEVVFILFGIVAVLSLMALSQEYSIQNGQNTSAYHVAATVLKSFRNWTFILGPHFMLGINTLIYSLVFYRSGLLPKKLAGAGILGAILVTTASLLQLFGIIEVASVQTVVLALPIAIYEMVLAVWLIIKGFGIVPSLKVPDQK